MRARIFGRLPLALTILVTSLAISPRTATAAGAISIVDQYMDQSTNLWQSIVYLSPIGQEFTPRLPALDAVELRIEEMSCHTWPAPSEPSAEVWLNIRQATIAGPIIGTSSPVMIPSCVAGIVKFDFPSLVSLAPSHLYVIDVHAQTLNPGVYLRTLGIGYDTYPGGQAIALGQREDGTDMWFREGLAGTTPRNKKYCANGLWQYLTRNEGSPFKNQGDCIQYVNTGR